MSWQAYVDTSLVGTGHVDKGAIISIAGDSVWATSSGYTISAEEMKNLASIVTGEQAAIDKAFAEGLHIAGERYVLAKAEDGSVYARKGREGIAIAKSKQAILVGHHGEQGVAGNTTQAVESLKDYLVGQGY
ncbi:profilin, required for normal timing of actin polymerization in response to thermal stress [Gnomoniopsis smithogilvyi]|uniref:Profilin n=1 Tax=Gnomoniopsis smithogilvyi TaxID=1191159 RepID=A0A9W8YTJ6_9PEZI|nr:profilin, required for normal timing of actin polymerization in response to thermal stress [Gnomoniopsis smithogilvyi]